jgi:hypothetical protein
MASLRRVAALSLAGAVPAMLGGVVFWAAHRQTAVTLAIAYAFWFAAAALLVLMLVAGRKWLWRRTSLPVPDGWEFVTSAVVLTAVGAAIDAAT